MTPSETATTLLTVGGRSLWAEVESRDTRPDERQVPPPPGRFHDAHCERLLLGCCLAAGPAAVLVAKQTGLTRGHFHIAKHGAIWATIGDGWPETKRPLLDRLGLMINYLDAEAAVDDEQWCEAVADADPLPTQRWITAVAAAQGLAERIVRLAAIRAKLAEAEALIGGRMASGPVLKVGGARV